ncbi:hypothetical protein FEE95_17690 [Maribacter algarum]|uniref:Lipoprotein n=1 Tax=Maribacter algarum (ex Zhang et al. 2020) TaxID=2578118 RepID=A0A5S3PJS3_9FLAO|nr:hypothetical protein [Maribacter algarum]TMM53731.1 hypothetical protein FEE95_17690 [Maribacter algarum]
MKLFIPLLLLTGLLFGCATRATTQIDSNTHNKFKSMERQKVEKKKGIVGYWDDLGKYTISFYQENTIDGQFTCVVPESKMVPEELRTAGAQIIFSGTITKDAQLPPARMGGEQVFLLVELDEIKSFNNN